LRFTVPSSTSAANRKSHIARFRKRTDIGVVVLIPEAVALTAVLTECGGGGGGSTLQNYALTVTATSGSVSQNTIVTLTVELPLALMHICFYKFAMATLMCPHKDNAMNISRLSILLRCFSSRPVSGSITQC
jgi:hypothetical protein